MYDDDDDDDDDGGGAADDFVDDDDDVDVDVDVDDADALVAVVVDDDKRALRVSPAVTRLTVYRGFAVRNSLAASWQPAQKMTNLRRKVTVLDFSQSLKIRFEI